MTWMGFNLTDWIVFAFLLFGLLGGIRRGLSGELTRLLIAAGCVAAVWRFSRPAADWVVGRLGWSSDVALLVAAAGVLLLAYLALTLVRLALAAVFNFAFKGNMEKIGGALCGALRAGLVAALLITLLSILPNEDLHRHVAVESRIGNLIYRHTGPWVERVAERVPELNLPRRTIDLPDEGTIDWMDEPDQDWSNAPLGPLR